jgi:tetratricopeptide (TPR) repeat protein
MSQSNATPMSTMGSNTVTPTPQKCGRFTNSCRDMSSIRWVFVFALLAGLTLGADSLPAAAYQPLDAFEQRLSHDPENLRVAAEYRQLVIAVGSYDRAIKFLGGLAKQPGAGANAHLNLALAYVDKVPVSGVIRQAYLGRDAISALTRSIAIAPSEVAFFIRGVVNLYYDRAIFHRADKGVADLEEAKRLSSAHPQLEYVSRIFVSLGDGYWRLGRQAKAKQVWQEGITRFPDAELLRTRVSATDEKLQGIIAHAFDADVRVDTSLRELFPDMPRSAQER